MCLQKTDDEDIHVSDPTALESFESEGYRVERVSNVRAEDLAESAIGQRLPGRSV